MEPNLEGDFATIEGLSAGTYYSRTAEATFATGVTITGALKRVVAKGVLQSGGLLVDVTVIWHITAAELGATMPRVSDVYVDADGVRWSVERVEVQTLATRYRLTCRREV